jgi:CheY-like chemotaxis protein
MTAPVIAILDEDPSFLDAMQALLTPVGYQAVCHRPHDVQGAHALVKRCHPQLVILDRWWRRGNEGWEFLKHLWADPETTHIAVVLTAGPALAPSLQTEILRTMRCRVVRAPVDRHELLRAIAALLGPSSIGQIPDWRVAVVPVPASVAAARGLGQLLDAASDS